MPMNGDLLGSEIESAIDQAISSNQEAGDAQRTALWAAIGRAIVMHIQTNAIVTTTVTVASVTLVTPGTGASGPGAGSGTGTVA